ncbi:unnamed protein product, partial [Allacma fusca]
STILPKLILLCGTRGVALVCRSFRYVKQKLKIKLEWYMTLNLQE